MTEKSVVRKPFLEHVLELRRRLFWSAVSMIAGAAVGYQFQKPIIEILMKPLKQPLFYTSPTGGLDFILKICIFFGIITSIPVFTYHVLKFLEPVSPRHIRRLVIKMILASTVLAGLGIAFAYFVSLPAALNFLSNFGAGDVKSLISTTEYFNFVTVYLAGFAILFQLPLILLLINYIKPLKPGGLMKQQRFVILASFVAAAVITPTPDPFNQTIMAGPIIVLYQLSVVLIWLVNRKRGTAAIKAGEAQRPTPVAPTQRRPGHIPQPRYAPAMVAQASGTMSLRPSRPVSPQRNITGAIDLRNVPVSDPAPRPALNVLDLRQTG